jgi:hypothetical protein
MVTGGLEPPLFYRAIGLLARALTSAVSGRIARKLLADRMGIFTDSILDTRCPGRS